MGLKTAWMERKILCNKMPYYEPHAMREYSAEIIVIEAEAMISNVTVVNAFPFSFGAIC